MERAVLFMVHLHTEVHSSGFNSLLVVAKYLHNRQLVILFSTRVQP